MMPREPFAALFFCPERGFFYAITEGGVLIG